MQPRLFAMLLPCEWKMRNDDDISSQLGDRFGAGFGMAKVPPAGMLPAFA
jgi:hypothetical protein